MKNKRLLWVLVILGLIVSSVVVEAALTDTLKGLGVIRGIRIYHLIVNTAIIALFVYVMVNLLNNLTGSKLLKADSSTGKVVFFIVLVGLSIAFALKAGDLFIWEDEAFVRPLFRYLFTVDEEGRIGILRPTRILVFIGASLLLSWLFISTVKIGQGSKWIDISIAILLAADMTHEGLTADGLIAFGQILSIWLLYKQFKREGEAGWSWSALVWSAGLVIWISAIAFPGRGIFAVRWIGDFFKAIGIFNSLLFIIVLALIFTVIRIFVVKKNKEAKERSDWLRGGVYITSAIKEWLNSNQLFAKYVESRYKTPEGHIPTMFRKMRIELITMMNYLLRLQVYGSKRKVVEDISKNCLDKYYIGEESDKKSTRTTRAAPRIKSDAIEYRHGRKISQQIMEKEELGWGDYSTAAGGGEVESAKYVPDTIWKRFEWYYDRIHEGGRRDSRTRSDIGCMDLKYAVLLLMNQLKVRLEDVEPLKNTDRSEDYINFIVGDELVNSGAGKIIDDALGNYESFHTLNRNYGLVLAAHAYSWQVLDQNNIGLNGWYKHQYKFARAHAKPKIYKINKEKLKDGKIVIENEIGEYTESVGTLQSGLYGIDAFLYEVDQRGRFLDDINYLKILAKRGEEVNSVPPAIKKDAEKEKISGSIVGPCIRKVDDEDVFFISSFEMICSNITADWDFFIKDVRQGTYHPLSKCIYGYTEMIRVGEFKFAENYKEYNKGRVSGPGETAFDLEAFKDPGKFEFRGKKYYHKEEWDNYPPNNYPVVSLQGMKEYIRELITRLTLEEKEIEEHLKDYVWPGKTGEKWFEPKIETAPASTPKGGG